MPDHRFFCEHALSRVFASSSEYVLIHVCIEVQLIGSMLYGILAVLLRWQSIFPWL